MLQPPNDARLTHKGQIKNDSQILVNIPKYINDWLVMRAKTLKISKAQLIREAVNLLVERDS